MSRRIDMMKLGAFVMQPGHHLAAWRHPAAVIDSGWNLDRMIETAQLAERGLMDMIFLADTQGGGIDRSDTDNISRQPFITEFAKFEPITLLAALATHTTHIGLVATATTTYFEPYILARQFASLDLLSDGRAGWNLVTSARDSEAANFGRVKHPDPGQRYARAGEFADVVHGLWNSWEEGAVIADRDTGVFFDPAKLHMLNHDGLHFSVAGPLNVPRSPQGHPVLVQAGSSEAGKELGARTADVVFTAQHRLESAKAFYADLKARMPRFGRAPDQLKVMPGVSVVVGSTDAEAAAKFQVFQDLIHPDITKRFLVAEFGRPELIDHPIDEPLPEWLTVDDGASRPALHLEMARSGNLTARELHLKVAAARGHLTIYGTAKHIADIFETWFQSHACDGFNLMPPLYPHGLADIIDEVVPELQRRGLFRTEYEGRTLRENLGLSLPRAI